MMEIIRSLKQEFSLDTTRFYLAGLSAGAMGVWDIMRDYPTMFAAAVPCAGIAPMNGAAAIARTPFWSFIGTEDMVIETVRDFIEAVEDLGIPMVRFVSSANCVNPTAISYDSLTKAVYGGANHLYSEVTGGNHNAGWDEAWNLPLLPAWVFSKTKPAQTSVTAPLPRNATAPSSPPVIRVPGIASLRIPPSWRAIADAVAFYTVDGRRLGRVGITDNTLLDIRSMGYGPTILFAKAVVSRSPGIIP
ncbi:MAG: hypothetical protein JW768_11315 [Chitinispirillaceae bacterium]|nr:hypothetical protein [Chitinispirillaceae bacterium]